MRTTKLALLQEYNSLISGYLAFDEEVEQAFDQGLVGMEFSLVHGLFSVRPYTDFLDNLYTTNWRLQSTRLWEIKQAINGIRRCLERDREALQAASRHQAEQQVPS